MRNFFRKNIFLVAPLVIVLFLTSHVGAVEVNTFDTEFSVNIVPNNPSPGTPVTAEIISYQFDADRSVITWTIGGEEITSGIGEKKINFVTPNFGVNKPMVVDIITSKGIETSKTINFSGDDIDILWEAGTETPIWYKGKALPVKKSYVRFYAVPHIFSGGKEVNPSSLIYEWKVNHSKISNASGFNRRGLKLRLNDNGEYSVGVKVMDKNKTVSFEKTIKMSSDGIFPFLLIYQNDPLKGPLVSKSISKKADVVSGDLSLWGDQFYLIKGLSQPTYQWLINGKKIANEGNMKYATFKSEGDSGEANVGLKVTSSGEGKSLYEVSKTIKINF